MQEREKFKVAIVAKVKHGELYKLLIDKGWTQMDLVRYFAERSIRVYPNEVSAWFRMKKVPKKPEVVFTLCELTQKTPEDLFPEFMHDSVWKKLMNETPNEIVKIKEVEPRALVGTAAYLLPSAEEVYTKKEIQKGIEEALSTLGPRYQKVIRLRFWEGKSYDQIAVECSITRASVDWIISKALRQLRHPARPGMRKVRRLLFS